MKSTHILADADERLKELLYDDSPWTDEEMDLLAVEVDALLDDDMGVGEPTP